MRERPAVAGERTMIAALARFRVPLGFLFGVVVLWLAAPTSATLIVGVAIAAVGEALRVWASGHLNKSREVTRSGPYRWFAHPLYVGSSVMGVGLAIAANSAIVAAIIGAYLTATLTAAVRSEEAFLRAKFGDEYDRYRRAADARDGAAPTARRFSLQQAIANREHRTIAGLAVAVVLLVLKAKFAR